MLRACCTNEMNTNLLNILQLTNSTLVHWGFCLPAVCSTRDAEILISLTTGHKNVTIQSDRCQTNEDTAKLTSIDVFYGYFKKQTYFFRA